jgi:hypothetical protein
MIQFNWRKWCRVIHRDLGYLFAGITVAYCISGLALNHVRDWNPNYRVVRREQTVPAPGLEKHLTKADVKDLLTQLHIEGAYKSHYFPTDGELKAFFEGGTLSLEKATGKIVVENLEKRPLLNTFNRLHLNPGKWWTWFADVFSAALLVVAISGLFLLRGYHGITRRGGVLVGIGILIPTVLVLHYL